MLFKKIGFLYNNHLHQVAHSAPIAFEISRHYPNTDIVLISASEVNLEWAETLSRRYPGHRCRFELARLPSLLHAWQHIRGKAYPPKFAVLAANRHLFKGLDALVVPEVTSRWLRWLGHNELKLIHTGHGAGDRYQSGYAKYLRQYDFVLLPGQKGRDRRASDGALRHGNYAVVGYPKFEAVRPIIEQRPRPFANDHLTVVYNPHFSRDLSSWFKIGHEVLEFFYCHQEYNFIFAPHLLLFEPAAYRMSRMTSIPSKYFEAENILIDKGSIASVNMSHLMAADIYLGDVSSQIYEFLVRIRPCIFLNTHHAAWRGDPHYRHWHCGPVVTSISELGPALRDAEKTHHQYHAIQRELFDYSFAKPKQGAAKRAADVIMKIALNDTVEE